MIKKNYFYFSYFLFLLLIMSSCEENDICTTINNNRLIVNMNDASNPSTPKAYDSIYVDRLDENGILEKNIIVQSNISKISIPINPDKNNTNSLFLIYNRRNKTEKDHILMNYKLKPNYISKACGFNYIITNANISLTKSVNVQSIKQINNSIENENIHCVIYH